MAVFESQPDTSPLLTMNLETMTTAVDEFRGIERRGNRNNSGQGRTLH
ncbi:MAG: hypothetical protein CM15mP74_33940 [Halieaceae bacterium]|nr:MAG: hypothetical protein CM15mP74_33940 [Halieaceae bacterium]